MRLFSLVIALCLLWPLSGQAAQAKYWFDAYRNGSNIGHHRITVNQEDEQVVVTVDIRLRVSFAGITLYRYEHDSREVWREGQLFSINSRTYDDGDQFFVNALRNDETDSLKVTHQDGSYSTEALVFPTSYWHPKFMTARQLVDTQSGKLLSVTMTPSPKQPEKFPAPGKAQGYQVSGDIDLMLWYDDLSRWVALAFEKGGSRIEYKLADAALLPAAGTTLVPHP